MEEKNQENQNQEQELDLNQLMKVRREKLARLQEEGKDPFTITKFNTTHNSKQIKDNYEQLEEKTVTIAGRIMAKRIMGKASFCHIQDGEGKIQSYVSINDLGEESYKQFKEDDIGDIIGITGFVFKTKTGEISIHAKEVTLLSKSLRPLPEKFHGLKDMDLRYRQRYVDLIVNPEVKDTFLKRTAIIKEIRNILDEKGYMEVETPILNTIAGGASARPFITHHNTLDMDMYLRIANELYLKRLIVGGFEKVYEMGRMFRNEGMDATHLQDFTMIEAYQAYYNYEDNMKLIQNMLQTIIQNIFGTLNITIGDKVIDMSGEWPKVSFRELIMKYVDIDINVYNTRETLLEKIKEEHIELDSDTPIENLGYGNLVDYLYKKVARPHILKPIYLTEHPVSLSPLARTNDHNSEITDRFQLVVNGAEIVNGYSELVDPQEQEKRLIEQSKLKEGGDEEAMEMDYDYIGAMEYGMPPISGWGMGIDRIVQLLTGSDNIRDVVMFPLMRPISEKLEQE